MEYSIVIAEDEELLLNNIVKKVEKVPGYQVSGRAQTGAAALDLITEQPPEVLLTDIQMPVMDGIELLNQARDISADMKFVILSGFSDFEYARDALRLQVYDYLLKPVSQDDITALLTRLKKDLDLMYHDDAGYFEQTGGSAPENARLLRDFIVEHFKEPINLSLIAEAMHYSQSYLSKIFFQEYQISPIKYLAQLRLQKASYYLTHNPELSILQVAQLTGFEDQGYFSKTFKKHTGYSPKEYRNHKIE